MAAVVRVLAQVPPRLVALLERFEDLHTPSLLLKVRAEARSQGYRPLRYSNLFPDRELVLVLPEEHHLADQQFGPDQHPAGSYSVTHACATRQSA